MSDITTVFLAASAAIVLGLLITKIVEQWNVPRTFTLIITGILIGVLNSLLERPLIHSELIRTEIELIATITLVIVLFNEGQRINVDHMKTLLRPIILLATVGILISAGLVGLTIGVLNYLGLLSMSILMALLIGFILSPTDPAATFASLRQAGGTIREDFRVLLAGEAGFNDVTCIVIVFYLMLPAVINDSFNITLEIILLAGWGLIGAVLVAVIVVYIITFVATHERNVTANELGILTLGGALLCYALATLINTSPLVASRIAGFLIGNPKIMGLPKLPIKQAGEFWEQIALLGETVAFVFVGLLIDVETLLPEISRVLPLAILLVIVLFGGRMLGVIVSLELGGFRDNGLKKWKTRVFISAAGMRGLTSIVLGSFAFIQLQNEFLLYTVVIFLVFSSLVRGVLVPLVAKPTEAIIPRTEEDLLEAQLKLLMLHQGIDWLSRKRLQGKISNLEFLELSLPIREALLAITERITRLETELQLRKRSLEHQKEMYLEIKKDLPLLASTLNLPPNSPLVLTLENEINDELEKIENQLHDIKQARSRLESVKQTTEYRRSRRLEWSIIVMLDALDRIRKEFSEDIDLENLKSLENQLQTLLTRIRKERNEMKETSSGEKDEESIEEK